MRTKIKYNKLFRKSRYLITILLIIFTAGKINAQEKPVRADKLVSFNLEVTNEQGIAIENARVVVGEGIDFALTDKNGTCLLKGYAEDFVNISAPGYEETIIMVQNILNNNNIQLKKSRLLMAPEDNVYLPFNTQKKRFLTGSSATITGNRLERYPTTDLRNALSGLVPGMRVREYNGSPGMSAEEKLGTYGITTKVGISSRGRNMMVIIDNIPLDITEMPLDPQEIESVTVIKDIVGKAMYGPMASDGIIFIKTKRGRANERILTVNTEQGVSVIDRFPEWTTGVDYAKLNNMARQNDGMTPLYSATDITAYAKQNPNDLYHPNVNFREMMLKNTRSFTKINLSSSGGDKTVQYSSYLGYNGEGDIYKIGPKADYNRLTASTNVDIKITDELKVSADLALGLTIRRSANYGYTATVTEGGAQTDLIEISSVFPDIIKTPPNAFPVYANNDPSLKFPWFGVSSAYPTNPVGNLISNGYYNEIGRKGNAKFELNYDMSRLIQGLSSETFLGYDILNLLRIGKAEDYWAYIVTPATTPSGNDTILFTKRHDGIKTNDLNNLHDYFYNRVNFFEKLNYQKTFGDHAIQSNLTYMLFKLSKDGIKEPERQQNGILTMNYIYSDRYMLTGVLNYGGTYTLEKNARYRLFPSIGAGWIISEENFMSNLKFIDFLKLHGQAGILGYEGFMAPYLYNDRWIASSGVAFGPHSANRWFGTTNQTVVPIAYPNRIGHPGLIWEEKKEISIGMDAILLKEKLSLEVSYYNNVHDGIITTLSNTLPSIAGISTAIPRANVNTIRYYGWETGIQWTNAYGKIKYSLGGNATIQNSEYIKFNEPDYRFDYQFTTGKPVDAYWGHTYLGKFKTDAEALAVPQIYDAVLKAGDLKYKDMNGDGFIDDNDRSVIGHTTPRLFYGINISLSYGNFDAYIMGTGAAFYDIPLTNSFFWNGWGDNNYSTFVRDNIGEAYPRLTYYKVNNNFIPSDFWLTKGDYFKIKNIELAYNIPPNKLQVIHSHGMRIFVRGANLLTLTKIKNVDPESINAGITTYPLYKTFTGGIKLTF